MYVWLNWYHQDVSHEIALREKIARIIKLIEWSWEEKEEDRNDNEMRDVPVCACVREIVFLLTLTHIQCRIIVMQNGRRSAESRKVSKPVAATHKALRATITKEHLSGSHNNAATS